MLQKPETGLDLNTCVRLLASSAYFRRISLKVPENLQDGRAAQ